MRYYYLTAIFFIAGSFSIAQETISVMYYNVLNYPETNSARITYLTTILQYVKPDILVVNEITSVSGSNTLLNSALNTGGITYYQAAAYVDGPDDENMLYYNSDKLGLIDQNEISTTLRDINEYILYYKNPNLTVASDTAYFYVYGAHLKAGTTASDENDRGAETVALKTYLANRSNPENTIVGGDMNIYGASESAYINLTGSSNMNLYDVVGAGEYHNNASYANHFTQSTRIDAFDGGSTGGMDDRFDFILFSDDVLSGQNGVKYKTSSYKAIGQDGLRWNQSLISPTNNSLPSNVINALYFMSDHIPVYLELEAGGEIGVEEINQDENVEVALFPNPASNSINLEISKARGESYDIIDLQGRIMQSGELANENFNNIDLINFESGTYFIIVKTDSGLIRKSFVKE